MLTAKELKGLTVRERSIARAQDEEMRVRRVKSETPYDYEVESTSVEGLWHKVTLADGGDLEGAKCDCEAAQKELTYCKHRAKAYLSFQNWLNTSEQATAFKKAWNRSELTAPIAGRILQIRQRRNVATQDEIDSWEWPF